MHKASSVTADGRADGFQPPLQYSPEASPEGITRLKISAGPADLPRIHRALVAALDPPLSVLYVQLTDRRAGQHLAERPRRFVGLNFTPAQVVGVFSDCEALIYRDGRHQIWVRGSLGDQLILDEMGIIYAYPDDLLFRDVLKAQRVPMGGAQTMEQRDYVRVEFSSQADGEEAHLIAAMGLREDPGA